MKKLLFFLLFSPDLFAQSKPDSLEFKVDALFNKYYNTHTPGCAVGIVRNAKVIFRKGYGMANLEYDIPISPSSIFDIASVSKQFAGFAISTLIQQGKISADDDIHKWLPDVPQFGKMITINNLLHHTSGLRDWPGALHLAGWRWDETFSFEDIMRMVKFQKDLDFEPGSRFSYSNTGFNLLAAIVEKVSGRSFREWTDSAIFKPLGMNSSHFRDDPYIIIKNLAYSYHWENSNLKKELNALTAYGSSSLFTSVDDLCKWVIHIQQGIDSKDPVFMRMLEEGALNNGEKVHYAYGFEFSDDHGLKFIQHTGGWAGYRTLISIYPDQKVSFILLSNVNNFDLNGNPEKIANILLHDLYKTQKDESVDRVKDLPSVKVDSMLMKKYAGTYQLGPGWSVTLSLENGQLMTQANGEDKFSTAAKSDSVFWIDAYGASMTFVKDPSGEVNLLRYKSIQAKRIIPFIPTLNQLKQYPGVYYSEELKTEYEVNVVGSKLFMHHMRLGDIELTPDPTMEDQFAGDMGTIHFIKNANQQITGLTVSQGRIKNIRFDKKS